MIGNIVNDEGFSAYYVSRFVHLEGKTIYQFYCVVTVLEPNDPLEDNQDSIDSSERIIVILSLTFDHWIKGATQIFMDTINKNFQSK